MAGIGERSRRLQDRFAFETLEQREMLAADIAVTLDNDTLRIVGTANDDRVMISNHDGQLRVATATAGDADPTSHTIRKFHAADVKRLEIDLGDGDDVVHLSSALDTYMRADISGGAGNDTIFGGAGNDVIDGGAGDDALYGRTGNDQFIGGAGSDMIQGCAGRDLVMDAEGVDRIFNVFDGTGADQFGADPAPQQAVKNAPSAVSHVTPNLTNGILTVRGTFRDDRISVAKVGVNIRVAGKAFRSTAVKAIVIVGESGNDIITVSEAIKQTTHIYGGHGNDTINGGGGRDFIYAGAGNDRVNGRRGNDFIWGGGGANILSGGLHTNRVYSQAPRRGYAMNSFEREIVRLTNLERTSRGLRPLAVNSLVAKAANVHVVQMVKQSRIVGDFAAFSHALWGVYHPTASTRFDFVGYKYFTYGENIAYGYPSAASVVAGWMNSPGHRANILSTSVTHIGVSALRNHNGTYFFSQNFGAVL